MKDLDIDTYIATFECLGFVPQALCRALHTALDVLYAGLPLSVNTMADVN